MGYKQVTVMSIMKILRFSDAETDQTLKKTGTVAPPERRWLYVCHRMPGAVPTTAWTPPSQKEITGIYQKHLHSIKRLKDDGCTFVIQRSGLYSSTQPRPEHLRVNKKSRVPIRNIFMQVKRLKDGGYTFIIQRPKLYSSTRTRPGHLRVNKKSRVPIRNILMQ